MGFRFSKKIKIAKGLSINLSKSGVSATIGPRGAKLNIGGKGGAKATVGIPGSGLSYTTQLSPARRAPRKKQVRMSAEPASASPHLPRSAVREKPEPVSAFAATVAFVLLGGFIWLLISLVS